MFWPLDFRYICYDKRQMPRIKWKALGLCAECRQQFFAEINDLFLIAAANIVNSISAFQKIPEDAFAPERRDSVLGKGRHAFPVDEKLFVDGMPFQQMLMQYSQNRLLRAGRLSLPFAEKKTIWTEAPPCLLG